MGRVAEAESQGISPTADALWPPQPWPPEWESEASCPPPVPMDSKPSTALAEDRLSD